MSTSGPYVELKPLLYPARLGRLPNSEQPGGATQVWWIITLSTERSLTRLGGSDVGEQAAVDPVLRSGEPGGTGGSQEDDEVGGLLGGPGAAHRDVQAVGQIGLGLL